jgi:hypothetical protein
MVEIKTPTTPIKAQKTEIITANSNAAVSILGSSKLQVTPADYVIAQSTYDGNVPKGISQWIQNEIALSVESGNVGTAIENIRTTLMNAISSGVNQYIETLTTDYVSQSSLITTLGSAIGAVDAKILNVQQTFATENEAFATEIAGLRAKLGDDGRPGAIEAYIGNIAIAAATEEFASATDMTSLVAVYNEQTLRIDTLDNVTVTPEGWTLGASKLATTPDNSIVGWSFSDGSNEVSEFKINAQKFSISDGVTGYTPFSISGTNVLFNGVVDFTNTNTYGTTTIDGGKITTNTVNANSIDATTVAASNLLVNQTMRSSDFTTIGGAGFRLKSNAAGTSADPTIYGAYIYGAKLGATILDFNDAIKTAEYYPNNSGPLSFNYTTPSVNISTSGTYYTQETAPIYFPGYGSGFISSRILSHSKSTLLVMVSGSYKYRSDLYTDMYYSLQVSVNGGSYSTIQTIPVTAQISGSIIAIGGPISIIHMPSLPSYTSNDYVKYRALLYISGPRDYCDIRISVNIFLVN